MASDVHQVCQPSEIRQYKREQPDRRVLFCFIYNQDTSVRKGKRMERYLMISDAAKEVCVESHVLRYWEEELHLPIRRNEMGHRYYTEGDVELFKQIKSMKEGGLQLKAIKMILKDGKLDVMGQENSSLEPESEKGVMVKEIGVKLPEAESREDKARRLQWLLQQMIRETLQENNKELCREIKESVVKELDYQFRAQEEKEEERDRLREEREEAHYQKLDALLRKKVKREKEQPEGRIKEEKTSNSGKKPEKQEKGKKHFAIFRGNTN